MWMFSTCMNGYLVSPAPWSLPNVLDTNILLGKWQEVNTEVKLLLSRSCAEDPWCAPFCDNAVLFKFLIGFLVISIMVSCPLRMAKHCWVVVEEGHVEGSRKDRSLRMYSKICASPMTWFFFLALRRRCLQTLLCSWETRHLLHFKRSFNDPFQDDKRRKN